MKKNLKLACLRVEGVVSLTAFYVVTIEHVNNTENIIQNETTLVSKTR